MAFQVLPSVDGRHAHSIGKVYSYCFIINYIVKVSSRTFKNNHGNLYILIISGVTSDARSYPSN